MLQMRRVKQHDRQTIVHRLLALTAALWLSTGAAHAQPEPQHALAMHGAPALDSDFAHLPYADPAAQKGGRMNMGVMGRFENLIPLSAYGGDPWQLRRLVFEPLMERSWDEPFTVYGLIAESARVADDNMYVEFTLRPEARFSNGDPITVEDVAWTFEKLSTEGYLVVRNNYAQVERVEITGERSIRFVFKEPQRELPLILGMMPILPKSVYETVDFSSASMQTPVGSGPYVVEHVEAGTAIRYRRNPDYWGADLPINAGRHNFDVIEYIYFRDRAVMFESFLAGDIDLYADGDPAHWRTAYDVPAVADGRIVRAEIAHTRPAGMRGFVFNTRRAVFSDRRVREAITTAFDYAWINQRLYDGAYLRMQSLFHGSPLGFSGPAAGLEATLLAPFADALPVDTLEEGWTPPEGAGDGDNRRNLRRAQRLLEQAGWSVADGVRVNARGEPLTFEILVRNSADEREAGVLIAALERLGVRATTRLIDSTEFQQRMKSFDFDMAAWHYVMSLSPGVEQYSYWSSEARDAEGSRNYAGVADPAVDAMIDAMMAARSAEEFQAAVRALDRALSSGVYFVPFGYLPHDLVAYDSGLRRGPKDPMYGYVYFDAWWRAEE